MDTMLSSCVPQNTTATKENSGKASRRAQTKRLLNLILFMSVLLLSTFLIVKHGTGMTDIKSKLRAKKERQNSRGLISSSSASGATTATRKEVSTNTGEGRLIEFVISNLDGIPGNEGKFVIQTRPSWSPLGAQRVEELVNISFYDNCYFFRVVKNFVVQWGINGDPSVQSEWRGKKAIKDEPVKTSNKRGTVVFAKSGKDTRTTQLYINTGTKNAYLDKEGFGPVAKVIEGMDIVDRIYNEYGQKPNQGRIQKEGNRYLEKDFPKMSYISKAYFRNESS